MYYLNRQGKELTKVSYITLMPYFIPWYRRIVSDFNCDVISRTDVAVGWQYAATLREVQIFGENAAFFHSLMGRPPVIENFLAVKRGDE